MVGVTDGSTPTAAGLFHVVRSRLAGAPREALGEWAAARGLWGWARAPRILRVGDAWHLGIFLIADQEVFTVGEVVRARSEAVRGFTAEAQRERAARAAAASRGGFAEGEAVHIGWQEIDLEAVDAGAVSGPVEPSASGPLVRWSVAGAPVPLAAYLDDQLSVRGL